MILVQICNRQKWDTKRPMLILKTLQIRMSQAYRMGFQDIARDSHISREFIKKYVLAQSGEDDEDNVKPRIGLNWEEELAKIQKNLKSHNITWNETSQPFITVDGTAQVTTQRTLLKIPDHYQS